MKAKDLRERTVDDLRDLEKSLAKDTFTHRFKNFTNRLDDTSLIRKTRRDLARVKTLLREQAAKDKGPAEGGEAKPAAAKAKKGAPPKRAGAAKPKAQVKAAAPKAAKPAKAKAAAKEKSE